MKYRYRYLKHNFVPINKTIRGEQILSKYYMKPPFSSFNHTEIKGEMEANRQAIILCA